MPLAWYMQLLSVTHCILIIMRVICTYALVVTSTVVMESTLAKHAVLLHKRLRCKLTARYMLT